MVLRRRISNVVRSGGGGVGGRLSETNKFPESDFFRVLMRVLRLLEVELSFLSVSMKLETQDFSVKGWFLFRLYLPESMALSLLHGTCVDFVMKHVFRVFRVCDVKVRLHACGFFVPLFS